jgi:hypothetical protein
VIDRDSSLLAQPQPNPPVAVGLFGCVIGFPDLLLALGIWIGSIHSFLPGIECGSRNPKEGAHSVYGVCLSVVFDDPISRLASIALRNSV